MPKPSVILIRDFELVIFEKNNKDNYYSAILVNLLYWTYFRNMFGPLENDQGIFTFLGRQCIIFALSLIARPSYGRHASHHDRARAGHHLAKSGNSHMKRRHSSSSFIYLLNFLLTWHSLCARQLGPVLRCTQISCCLTEKKYSKFWRKTMLWISVSL
jgi:hypothetical protein